MLLLFARSTKTAREKQKMNKSIVPSTDDGMTSFIPSVVFNGKRIGYMFKNGSKGIGYYNDPAQQQIIIQSSSSNVKDNDSLLKESIDIKSSQKRSRIDDDDSGWL